MPAAVAIPLAIGAGTAAAGIGGAALQSSAAKDAAQKQTEAANYAAQKQAESAANALAFQKQQAAQDLATADATQHANYNQWAARQGRLSTLGQMVGMQPFQIPAYVPLQNAHGVTPTGTPQGAPNPNVQPMSNLLRYPVQY